MNENNHYINGYSKDYLIKNYLPQTKAMQINTFQYSEKQLNPTK
jgi:hypothetical protein